ncbi:serine protease 3-like [Drosophila innubila]|uniref:serine protease 3-like n=1 Tax=Drosophila innubila TaxID=198719 RepID=UPI00148D9A1B|nr:serine protease 3-like [Drosophila innubila]
MNLLIIFTLAVVATASAFTDRELVPRNRVMPVLARTGIEGRITNGETASEGQFPYQVGLYLQINAFSYGWCGGVLIDHNWVATAAHCLDGVKSATVYLGAHYRLMAKVVHSVAKSKFIIHPDWNRQTLAGDIGLIKIPYTPYCDKISPVKLPAISTTYPTYAGDIAVASGWGLTSDTSTTVSDTLQYVLLKVIENADCAAVYGSIITNGILCVDTIDGKSTCSGDSGGPLTLNSDKTLIGLVSFGAAVGCEQGLPAGFTRVTKYRGWIKDKTGL